MKTYIFGCNRTWTKTFE